MQWQALSAKTIGNHMTKQPHIVHSNRERYIGAGAKLLLPLTNPWGVNIPKGPIDCPNGKCTCSDNHGASSSWSSQKWERTCLCDYSPSWIHYSPGGETCLLQFWRSCLYSKVDRNLTDPSGTGKGMLESSLRRGKRSSNIIQENFFPW